MKFSAIFVSAFATASLVQASLVPECASNCAYVLEKTGCGPLTESNMDCFCENKDRVINEAQNCLMSSRRCSFRELLDIRRRIVDRCGSF